MIRASLTAALLLSMVGASSAASVDLVRVVHNGAFVARSEMLAALTAADVVFVGEQHDHAAGHAFQLELLQDLARSKRACVLSLEMFERDVQQVVDEYLHGHITESAFLAASRPWSNYRTDYRPLVEFCRENRIPVVAANVPRRYVNIVSRKGMDALRALPRDSRRWLPRLPVPTDISEGYDQALSKVFGSPHGAPAGPGMPSVENLKQAQSLWDAGMSDSIVRALGARRGALIIHVCGAMHSDSGYGIVERMRLQRPRLRVATTTIKPLAEGAEPDPRAYSGLADWVVLAAANAPGRTGAGAP